MKGYRVLVLSRFWTQLVSSIQVRPKGFRPKSIVVQEEFHSIKTMWYHYFPSPEKNNKKIEKSRRKIPVPFHHQKKGHTEKEICRPESLLISQLLLLFASAAPTSSSAALLRSSSRQPDPFPTTGVWKFSGLGSMLLSFDRPKPHSE